MKEVLDRHRHSRNVAPGVAFPMPVTSLVFNGLGTINFTVNIYLGNVSVGASCSEASYEKLLEGMS